MRKLVAFISVIFMCLFCSCGTENSASNENELSVSSNETSKAVYQKLSAEQAKSIMDTGKLFILLDVRTDEEFREKRIDGAVLIPDYEIKDRASVELPDKNALILIYCRSGNRSKSAANEMINMGYTNAYDFGGINDWPYGTVSG